MNLTIINDLKNHLKEKQLTCVTVDNSILTGYCKTKVKRSVHKGYAPFSEFVSHRGMVSDCETALSILGLKK